MPENSKFRIKDVQTEIQRLENIENNFFYDLKNIFPENFEEGWECPPRGMLVIESLCQQYKRHYTSGIDVILGWQELYHLFFKTDFSKGIINVNKISELIEADSVLHIYNYCLLGLWRLSRNVFTFDPTLYEKLKDTENCKLPIGALDRYPYWSTYVNIPDEPFIWLGEKVIIKGLLFTACSALDNGNKPIGNYEVTVMFQHVENKFLYFITPMVIIKDLKENVLSFITYQGLRNNKIEDASYYVLFWLSINVLLYINVYLQTIYKENGRRHISNPSTIKKGKILKWIAASKNTNWDVGKEIGEQIRTYNIDNAGGHHKSPSPHIRRAHWHLYHVGPRNESSTRLNWIPPVPVAMPKSIIMD